jgi:hypothetical protein
LGIILASLVGIEFASSATSRGSSDTSEQATNPPYSFTLGSLDNNSRIQLDCEGRKPYPELVCKFTWLTLEKVSEAQINEAQAKLDAFDRMSESEIQPLKQDLKKTFSSDSDAALHAGVARGTPEQEAAAADLANAAKQLSTASTRTELKAAMIKLWDMDRDTCKIQVHEDEKLVFKRMSPTKWIRNLGPQGDCHAVEVGVLEAGPVGMWTYRTTTVSADTDTKVCADIYKGEVSKVHVYSWDAPEVISPACKYIRLGH